MINLAFIFIVLPITLAVYVLTPNRYKNTALLVINAAVYLIFFRSSVPMLVLCGAVDFLGAEYIEKNEKRVFARIVLIILVAKNIIGAAILGYVAANVANYVVPVGFLVYALTASGYLIDVFYGDAESEKNLGNYYLFATFFSKAEFGPIAEINQFRESLRRKNVTLLKIGEGFELFSIGLAKKVVIAELLFKVYETLKNDVKESVTFTGCWLMVISFMLWVYFFYSGYTNMARGIGKMFGIEFPENFKHPYKSRSIKAFFNRFNTSTSFMLRRCVYQNVKKDGYLRVPGVVFGVVAVCIIWAMCFGSTVSVVVWGVYIALFIIFEELIWGKKLNKISYHLSRIYTFIVCIFSFAILGTDTLGDAGKVALGIVGVSNGIISDAVKYVLNTSGIVIIIGIVAASGIVDGFFRRITYKYIKIRDAIMSIYCAAALVVAIIFLV